jgi:hypothetical protein
MDIFTAVMLDGRSVVPDAAQTFSTLAKAKVWVESTSSVKGMWEEWEEGKFVYGFGVGDEVDEPIAAVYGSELDTAIPD